MKTRLIALAVALSLTAAGCSAAGPAAPNDASGSAGATNAPAGGESKQVTVWMYPVIADAATSQTFWGDTEKAFEAENPNIDLAIELQPWDGRDEKIATALASGKGPDLVVLGPDQLPQYHANGGLKSLKGALEGEEDKFLKGALEAATLDGDTYAVPIYHTVTTAVYNKKVFNDAGITELPTTWDQIKAAAPTLKEKGVAVLDYSGDPKVTLNLSFYPLLWQAGGSVFSEDGSKVAFNSPEGKETLQFLVDLQQSGGLPADAATKGNKVEGGGLSTGQTAMGYALVKAEAATMQKALGEDAVEVGMPLTNAEQVTFGLPGLLARTSIGEDDESVNAVAKFLASADSQVKLAEASGFFPARTDATLDSSDPLNAKYQAALEFAKPGEINPKARQVMAALAPHIQAALQGSKSVDQALADAEAEANAQLG